MTNTMPDRTGEYNPTPEDRLKWIKGYLSCGENDETLLEMIWQICIEWLVANTDKTAQGLAYELDNIRQRKNNDYGNSFERLNNQFGPLAGVIRIHDKINRILSLVDREQQVVDESLIDTYMDLANYANMQLEWLERRGGKEHGEED